MVFKNPEMTGLLSVCRFKSFLDFLSSQYKQVCCKKHKTAENNECDLDGGVTENYFMSCILIICN